MLLALKQELGVMTNNYTSMMWRDFCNWEGEGWDGVESRGKEAGKVMSLDVSFPGEISMDEIVDSETVNL